MATDNRTVIGGYIAPNGAVVEEVQYSPRSYTIAPPTINNRDGNRYTEGQKFTPAETYKFQSDGYYNLGDTDMGDAYSALWRGSDMFSNTAKLMNSFFNQYGNEVAKREMALAGVKSDLANKLYSDMSKTREYVNETFGPNGTLTKEINKYYDDLGNYLATDAGRQAATIAAQGMHSGASLGAIRAQQNEAYNQTFARYLQAKEQEINAKQQIAANLINYMSTLRQEFGDTTNAYIIGQYQRSNDLLNAISQSIVSSNIELNNARLSNALKNSTSGGSYDADYKLYTEFYNKTIAPNSYMVAFWQNADKSTRNKVFQNWLLEEAAAKVEADKTKNSSNGGGTTNDTKGTSSLVSTGLYDGK